MRSLIEDLEAAMLRSEEHHAHNYDQGLLKAIAIVRQRKSYGCLSCEQTTGVYLGEAKDHDEQIVRLVPSTVNEPQNRVQIIGSDAGDYLGVIGS